jgi:Gpi18-like mannosyltransferase
MANNRRWLWLIIGAGIALALAIRWSLRDFVTGDLTFWVIPWYDYIFNHGSRAFGTNIPSPNPSGNYTPPYYYFLYGVSFFDPVASKIVLIKTVSVCFDFLAAFFAFRIVRLGTTSAITSWLAFFAVLFAPTVIANGALWGQSDAIQASLLLGSIYFSLSRRPFWTVVLFGLALSVKAQAVFLSPYILALVLSSRLPWSFLPFIPLTYTAMMVPAVLMGRPLTEVFQIYVRQATLFHELSMNAPNLYYFAPDGYYATGTTLGTACTVFFSLLFALYARCRRTAFSTEFLVLSATTSLVLAPFLLPKMHDRYFFSADLCSITLGFVIPRLWFVPVALQISSAIAYVPIISESLQPEVEGGLHTLMPIAVLINTLLAFYLTLLYFVSYHKVRR